MDVDPTPGASGLLPTEDVDMEEGTVEKGEEGEDEVPPPPPMPDLNTPEDAIAYWSSSMEKVSFVEKKIWFGRTLQARVVIFLLFFFQGNLSCHHFREWWRRIVPRLLSPSPNMDYKAPQAHIDDEEVVQCTCYILVAPSRAPLALGLPKHVTPPSLLSLPGHAPALASSGDLHVLWRPR